MAHRLRHGGGTGGTGVAQDFQVLPVPANPSTGAGSSLLAQVAHLFF